MAGQNESPNDDVLACFSPHLAPDNPGRPRAGEPKGLGEPKILRGEEALRRTPLKAVLGSAPGGKFGYRPQAARSVIIINLSQIIRELGQLRVWIHWHGESLDSVRKRLGIQPKREP
jgi:hypothetical protein